MLAEVLCSLTGVYLVQLHLRPAFRLSDIQTMEFGLQTTKERLWLMHSKSLFPWLGMSRPPILGFFLLNHRVATTFTDDVLSYSQF